MSTIYTSFSNVFQHCKPSINFVCIRSYPCNTTKNTGPWWHLDLLNGRHDLLPICCTHALWRRGPLELNRQNLPLCKRTIQILWNSNVNDFATNAVEHMIAFGHHLPSPIKSSWFFEKYITGTFTGWYFWTASSEYLLKLVNDILHNKQFCIFLFFFGSRHYHK